MKKIITLLLTITFVFSASAQLRWNSLYQTYISQYKDLAIEEMLKHKIPAHITLAQGLLESCAGNEPDISSFFHFHLPTIAVGHGV